ncbi:hypothetical protein [Desulfonema magnum]|uniref:PilZ domain-containing protein n=1 Tax=Desulfonema magnum TaxID=45655 RepID=A0A975BFT2_9BACT|nr:hypothetical protein [Desulfonema magnum]QTA84399.1 Uncharacterized protein dnm_003930 [Desulfonema magnum]
MKPERRNQPRFLTSDNAFIAMGIRMPKIGKIKDISLNGLAFEYLVNCPTDKADREDSHEKFSQANLFLVGGEFSLTDIPCIMVYDIIKYIFTQSLIVKKQCGVRFGELGEDQAKELGLFLAYHTTGSEV